MIKKWSVWPVAAQLECEKKIKTVEEVHIRRRMWLSPLRPFHALRQLVDMTA